MLAGYRLFQYIGKEDMFYAYLCIFGPFCCEHAGVSVMGEECLAEHGGWEVALLWSHLVATLRTGAEVNSRAAGCQMGWHVK